MITGFRTTVCVKTAYDLSKRSYDMNNNFTACAPRNAGCYTLHTIDNKTNITLMASLHNNNNNNINNNNNNSSHIAHVRYLRPLYV